MPHNLSAQIWILAIVLVALAHAGALAEEQKLKPPPDAALAKAEAMLKEVYKAEFAQTETAQRRAFAKRLLQQARDERTDAAARFVLLREARNVAASSGDMELALKAIDEMGKVFAIDPVEHKTAAALSASRSIDDMQQAVIFLSTSVSLVNQYAGSGDFAAVNKLTPPINFVSTQTRNREIIAGVRNRLAQIKDAQAEYTG